MVAIDFTECLKDSPLFRKNLSKAESDVESYEIVFKRVIFNLAFKSRFFLIFFHYLLIIPFLQR